VCPVWDKKGRNLNPQLKGYLQSAKGSIELIDGGVDRIFFSYLPYDLQRANSVGEFAIVRCESGMSVPKEYRLIKSGDFHLIMMSRWNGTVSQRHLEMMYGRFPGSSALGPKKGGLSDVENILPLEEKGKGGKMPLSTIIIGGIGVLFGTIASYFTLRRKNDIR